MDRLATGIVQQIVQNSDILEVIGEYVPLTKAGKEYKGLCPFHPEKTPSFTVNAIKKVFYCFGCGSGGDVISFLMKYESLSFIEAVELLAKRQGVKIEYSNVPGEESVRYKEKELIIEINELAAKYYHSLLLDKAIGRSARRYFDFRGLSSEIIKEFCLGCSKNVWRDLLLFLGKKNIPTEKILQSGLMSSASGNSDNSYDRFRGRIIFPISNEYGQIVALGGRKIDENSVGPKYLNSSETIAYSKSKCLYGLYHAKEFIRASGYALVVEGYLDFLSLYQRGVKNTVATLGTALTLEHVRLLGRYAKKVVFVYDADPAGISAMLRGLPLFQQQNIEVRILLLPAGFDPDSFVRQYGQEELQKRIEESIPAVEFLIHQSMSRNNISTIEGKAEAAQEIGKILSKVCDPVKRMEYTRIVANSLDIKEEILLDLWKQRSAGSGDSSISEGFYLENSSPISAEEKAEKILLSLVCRGEISIEDIKSAFIRVEDFKSGSTHEIAKTIFLMWQEKGMIKTEELLFALKDEKLKGMVSHFICDDINYEDRQKVFQDCVGRLRSRTVINKLNILHKEIRSKPYDDPEIDQLLKEYADIKKKK